MKAITLVAASLAAAPAMTAPLAVGPQYDSTHIYVAPADMDRFVASIIATFGGTASKRNLVQVTPTPSRTQSQLIQTPAGTMSVFGFETPIPYPFGAERTGYLVSDLDGAVKAAKAKGAAVLVEPFPDPIGRDALISWPGGVGMQLYWHTITPHYPALATIPENRIYLTRGAADAFVRGWIGFSHGRILSDEPSAPGTLIGRPDAVVRRVRIASDYGAMVVLASDGALPWPYGRDVTGYAVSDLAATLVKAQAAGAELLVPAGDAGGRQAAMLRFPGGYIAEVHQADAH